MPSVGGGYDIWHSAFGRALLGMPVRMGFMFSTTCLSHCANLKDVNLSNNYIGDVGAIISWRRSEPLYQLEGLDLSSNLVSDVGARVLYQGPW